MILFVNDIVCQWYCLPMIFFLQWYCLSMILFVNYIVCQYCLPMILFVNIVCQYCLSMLLCGYILILFLSMIKILFDSDRIISPLALQPSGLKTPKYDYLVNIYLRNYPISIIKLSVWNFLDCTFHEMGKVWSLNLNII